MRTKAGLGNELMVVLHLRKTFGEVQQLRGSFAAIARNGTQQWQFAGVVLLQQGQQFGLASRA